MVFNVLPVRYLIIIVTRHNPLPDDNNKNLIFLDSISTDRA